MHSDIRRARLVDASQNTAWAGRSLLTSDTFSTSITFPQSGDSRRNCFRKLKDVFRRVLIAVVLKAAVFAGELAREIPFLAVARVNPKCLA